MLPSLVDDGELGDDSHTLVERANGSGGHGAGGHPPLISGFIALVRVFLCVVDLLSSGFPGSPPQAYSMGSGTLRPRVFPEDLAEPPISGCAYALKVDAKSEWLASYYQKATEHA